MPFTLQMNNEIHSLLTELRNKAGPLYKHRWIDIVDAFYYPFNTLNGYLG